MKNDNVQGKTDNTKGKAQENHVKMTQTPVPYLILPDYPVQPLSVCLPERRIIS